MMTSTLILKTSKQHLTIRHVGRSASHAGYNPRKAAQVVAYFALRSGTRSIDADKAAIDICEILVATEKKPNA